MQPNKQTENEQRRQNWAAIDSLVREFITEADRRGTRPEGRRHRQHWVVNSSQSKWDSLLLDQDGSWTLHGEGNGPYIELLTRSGDTKKGPRKIDVVEGLREGAMRLLNS